MSLVSQLDRTANMKTELVKATGMTCGGCTSKVAHALEALPGVVDVRVSLAAGEATVLYDNTRVSSDQLERAVTGAGFGLGAAWPARSGHANRGCCG
jgi:copper chaperone CopZ